MHRHKANASREFTATSERAQNLVSLARAAVLLRDKIERKFALAAARDCIAQSLLVRRENSDALSATRDRHIPLLRI